MSEFPRLSRQDPAPTPGIVHLGLGAFFRAHGAQVIEDAVRAEGGDWGIVGASMRSPDIRDRLLPQGFAYQAVELAPIGQTRRVVEVVSDVLFAPADPAALIARMADPRTQIVSLTVTEKGYSHFPSTGELDQDHPDVLHDVANKVPKGTIGYIVRALQERHRVGTRPFTVMSCDNLPNNGEVARNVVTGLARLIDPALADWIEAEGRFPSSMVDRIVPAVTAEEIADLAKETGIDDQAPVFHEPFLQWVIEDSFVGNARPTFEASAGVLMVKDVAPYEAMKLRMLNGTHSALAYLGYLAGHETISATVADPTFAGFVKRLWTQEIVPTLSPPDGVDLMGYADALFQRYANPAIRHRTWQIAMDGSQKLPQRILGTIADGIAVGTPTEGLCLSVAAWMRYVGGLDETGGAIDVRDPLAAELRALSDAADTLAEKVGALFSVKEVFGEGVDPRLRASVTTAYGNLVDHGAAQIVARLAKGATSGSGSRGSH